MGYLRSHGDLADGNSGVQTSHGQDHPSSRSTVFSRENQPFSIAIFNDRRVVTGYSAISWGYKPVVNSVRRRLTNQGELVTFVGILEALLAETWQRVETWAIFWELSMKKVEKRQGIRGKHMEPGTQNV